MDRGNRNSSALIPCRLGSSYRAIEEQLERLARANDDPREAQRALIDAEKLASVGRLLRASPTKWAIHLGSVRLRGVAESALMSPISRPTCCQKPARTGAHPAHY